MSEQTQSSEDDLERLRAELHERTADAAAKESQLERYAADLRETFKRERERSRQLRDSYMATVRALSNAVEARDAYTGKHAERVAAYGLELAGRCGMQLAESPEIEFGFLLHDIGKVAIPDAILFKPEPLSDAERAVMERHTVIGWEILRGIDFLGEAKSVVRSHHEQWNGSGYPDGLSRDEIPLSARVFAVADVLDALTTLRPYRAASPLPFAREVIMAGAGSQFDPDIISVFASIHDERFEELRQELG